MTNQRPQITGTNHQEGGRPDNRTVPEVRKKKQTATPDIRPQQPLEDYHQRHKDAPTVGPFGECEP